MGNRRFVCALAVFVACGGCAPPDSGVQLGVRVAHLTSTGPQDGLPEGVDTLRVLVTEADNMLLDVYRSMVALDDLDGDGEDDKEVAIEIPPDRAVSITVLAYRGPSLLATTRADGIVVRNGGRRYVELTFTPVRAVTALPEPLPSGRFGHATAIVETDGRALVTGGFATGEPVSCPSELSQCEICFSLVATDEAYLIDPASGALYATQGAMLQPRALHTATSLPDGRVLIVGGVDAATLGLELVEGGDTDQYVELWPHIVPSESSGHTGALHTFEIFDPTLNREESDLGRDGDPTSGGFTGAPGQAEEPGQTNSARLMHGAVLIPGDSWAVLIAGGQGTEDAAHTGELFDPRRPGGAGFVYPPAPFSDPAVPRVWPGAAAADGSAFVIGGVFGSTDAIEVADRAIVSEEDGELSFENLSDCRGWSPADRPANALVAPSVAVFGRDAPRVLATGWLGPLCNTSNSSVIEVYGGSDACSPATYGGRAFTMRVSDCAFGRLQDQSVPHFMGAAVGLPNGQAVIAGGYSDGSLSVTNRVEVYTGEFTEANLALRNRELTPTLTRGRAWLTGTSLHGGRVLLAGGMNFAYSGTDPVPEGIELSGALEIYDPGLVPVEVTAQGSD